MENRGKIMGNASQSTQYDQFLRLFAKHERAVRCFVRSMLPTNQDVDDVLRKVGLACWRKFGDFGETETQDAFLRWAYVVARFEVLRHRRNCARDKLILSEETIQSLAAGPEAKLNGFLPSHGSDSGLTDLSCLEFLPQDTPS